MEHNHLKGKFTLTETDLICKVVKEFELSKDNQLISVVVKGRRHGNHDQILKEAIGQKIWQSLCKQLKQSLIENKIFDSVFFGTFAKDERLSAEFNTNGVVYCPGPKSELKLIKNDHN